MKCIDIYRLSKAKTSAHTSLRFFCARGRTRTHNTRLLVCEGFPISLDYTFAIALSRLRRQPSSLYTFQSLPADLARNYHEAAMTMCVECGRETTNPKFCSRSCAAIYSNHFSPKRKRRVYHCQICGTQTTHRRKYCDAHQPNALKSYDQVTLESIRKRAKYQANALIRRLARRSYRSSEMSLQCRVCGYSKHVEICHIRAIEKFSTHTHVSEINSIDNLVALCPNHH